MLEPNFFGKNCNVNLKLMDIYLQNGEIMSKAKVDKVIGEILTVLKYNTLKSIIPTQWRKSLKIIEGKVEVVSKKPDTPLLKINMLWKPLDSITTKNINQKYINSKIVRPTAEETWIDIFPFLEDLEWSKIYTLPYKITKEPFLQSLQYKVLNRIVNCKERLFKWKISENNICNYCENIDTLEHHLINCKASKRIWDSLDQWIRNNLLLIYRLTECEILLGIPNTNSTDLQIMNFLILFTKCFINRKKTLKSQIYFIDLLKELKIKVEIIMLSNLMNDRQTDEWLDQLNNTL